LERSEHTAYRGLRITSLDRRTQIVIVDRGEIVVGRLRPPDISYSPIPPSLEYTRPREFWHVRACEAEHKQGNPDRLGTPGKSKTRGGW
jgi:hypothetical protein